MGPQSWPGPPQLGGLGGSCYVSGESDLELSLETARVWCIAHQDDVAPPCFPYRGTPGIQVDLTDKIQSLDFFELYFDDTLLDMICTETNKYAEQTNIRNWRRVYISELRLFFALIIHNGIVRMLCERIHWSKYPLFAMPIYKSVMSLARYEKQALHFSNNETYNPNLHPVTKLNKIYEVYCYL